MTASVRLTTAESLAPAGLGDPGLPSPGTWTLRDSCVPFRAPGPGPGRDSRGLGSRPSWLVLPGPDHEEGVGRE